MTTLSVELLRQYNVQGPRYTSYPPAPSWGQQVSGQQYEKTIINSNEGPSPAPISLYLHLPFCERLCFFCGCTTLITGKNRSFTNPYFSALSKEISWVGSRVSRKRKVIQLHLGGGTPTYNSAEELENLVGHLKNNFTFDDEAEMGIEVDPRVTNSDHLKKLRKAGFNRISMGVQDFNPQVQKAVNRIQPYEQTKAIVDEARSLGYISINIDLIYGLPYQTTASFTETIEKILTLNPDRLAVYSYAHVPWLKEHQEHFEKHLPQEKEKYEIFLAALSLFNKAGYVYIGMDHFAKPTDELAIAQKERTLWRNFMGYTTKAGTDLFGLGMSSIGSVHGGFFQNQRDISSYQDAINKQGPATMRGFILSTDDKIRGRVIQNLLCHAILHKNEIEKEFSIQFDQYFSQSLKALKKPEDDGLVEITKEFIKPTAVGRVFLRNLAMPFDAYLPKTGPTKIFSRTI